MHLMQKTNMYPCTVIWVHICVFWKVGKKLKEISVSVTDGVSVCFSSLPELSRLGFLGEGKIQSDKLFSGLYVKS